MRKTRFFLFLFALFLTLKFCLNLGDGSLFFKIGVQHEAQEYALLVETGRKQKSPPSLPSVIEERPPIVSVAPAPVEMKTTKKRIYSSEELTSEEIDFEAIALADKGEEQSGKTEWIAEPEEVAVDFVDEEVGWEMPVKQEEAFSIGISEPTLEKVAFLEEVDEPFVVIEAPAEKREWSFIEEEAPEALLADVAVEDFLWEQPESPKEKVVADWKDGECMAAFVEGPDEPFIQKMPCKKEKKKAVRQWKLQVEGIAFSQDLQEEYVELKKEVALSFVPIEEKMPDSLLTDLAVEEMPRQLPEAEQEIAVVEWKERDVDTVAFTEEVEESFLVWQPAQEEETREIKTQKVRVDHIAFAEDLEEEYVQLPALPAVKPAQSLYVEQPIENIALAEALPEEYIELEEKVEGGAVALQEESTHDNFLADFSIEETAWELCASPSEKLFVDWKDEERGSVAFVEELDEEFIASQPQEEEKVRVIQTQKMRVDHFAFAEDLQEEYVQLPALPEVKSIQPVYTESPLENIAVADDALNEGYTAPVEKRAEEAVTLPEEIVTHSSWVDAEELNESYITLQPKKGKRRVIRQRILPLEKVAFAEELNEKYIKPGLETNGGTVSEVTWREPDFERTVLAELNEEYITLRAAQEERVASVEWREPDFERTVLAELNEEYITLRAAQEERVASVEWREPDWERTALAELQEEYVTLCAAQEERVVSIEWREPDWERTALAELQEEYPILPAEEREQVVLAGWREPKSEGALSFAEEVQEKAIEIRPKVSLKPVATVWREKELEPVAIEEREEPFIYVQKNKRGKTRIAVPAVRLEAVAADEASIGSEWGWAENRVAAVEKEVFELSGELCFDKEMPVSSEEVPLEISWAPIEEEKGEEKQNIEQEMQLLVHEFEEAEFVKEPNTKGELQFAQARFEKLEESARLELEKEEPLPLFAPPVPVEKSYEIDLHKVSADFEEKGGEEPPEIEVKDLFSAPVSEEAEEWTPRATLVGEPEAKEEVVPTPVVQEETVEKEPVAAVPVLPPPPVTGEEEPPAWFKKWMEKVPSPRVEKCVPDPCPSRWDGVWLPKLLSVQHVWGDQEEKCIPFATNYTTVEAIFAPEYCLGHIMPMMDVRGHRFDNNTYAANVGLGGRYIPNPSCDRFCEMMGFNAYYDYRQGCIGYYHQIGAGVEILSHRWDFRANAYAPFGAKRHIHTCTFEYPGDYWLIRESIESISYSFNAEIGWLLFEMKDRFMLYAAAGPYFIARAKCDDGVVGVEARLRPQYRDYLALDLSWRYDQLFKTIWQVGIIFNLPLYQIAGRNKEPCGLGDWQIYQPVQRFEVMPLSKKTCWQANFE